MGGDAFSEIRFIPLQWIERGWRGTTARSRNWPKPSTMSVPSHRLPILADALEEAGCDNADILNHCRQADSHVRGCWLLDLLLGKE